MQSNKGEGKSDSRLAQILEILKSNEVTRGMSPLKLRKILEELGPTFVKLGQVMSMRSDLIPDEYCKELAHLRSQVEALPFDEVRQVIEEEYKITTYKEVFTWIDESPLGSASIAQVHQARLKGGKQVVIKVQRPNIKEKMASDIIILRKAIKLVKWTPGLGDAMDFKVVIEEMWVVAQEEMNFLIEAAHLEEFQRLNEQIMYVACPIVERYLSTEQVLVMEYIKGIAIDQIEQLEALGYIRGEIGQKLAQSYAKQVLDDGFFHADPHPGNLSIRDGKIIWIDWGMIGRLSTRDRELFVKAVKAVLNGDIYELKNVVLAIGVVRGKINHSALYDDLDLMVAQYSEVDFASINLGKIIMDFITISSKHNIGIPQGVSMLGRGIVTLEGVLAQSSPQINFIAILREHMAGKSVDFKRELQETSQITLLNLKKGLYIPAYLSDVLKMTAKGQTKINLEITGSEEPLAQINKMINKLIIAIICTGLLVGSSLICTTGMAGKLFGIPALGGVGFLLALILGSTLVFDILRKR